MKVKHIVKMAAAGLIMSIAASAADLKVAIGNSPRNDDPHKSTDSYTLNLTKQIYNNLFSLTGDGEIAGELAESYEIDSEGSIHLKLRKGVRFHDGEEMKAEDVVKSIKRNYESNVTKVLVENIKEVKALDEYTVKLSLNSSPSLVLHNLTHSSTAVVKEKDGKLIGTGPFSISEWKLGEKISLKNFDDYFQGKSSLDSVTFVIMPEISNRTIALETGEVDISYDIGVQDIELVKKNPKLAVIEAESFGTDFISINTGKAELNKKFRQGLEYAIDKKALIGAILDGYSKKADTILAPGIFGYTDKITERSFDLEKSRELLKEAGFPKGKEISIWTYSDPIKVQMAQIIQSNLKDAGVESSIQVTEVGTFLQRTAAGEHDILLGLWYVSTGDADFGLYPLLHSSSAGAPGNRSFYSNREVDTLLDSARLEKDSEKRRALYEEAQKIIHEDTPIVPLMYKVTYIGVNKKVSGFASKRNGNYPLKDIVLK